MTTDEIDRMCDVLEKADDGCAHCVNNIYERAIDEFPEYREQLQSRLRRFDGGC